MARLNVSIPDDLDALVREQLPKLNVSAALQECLREKLKCSHADLECAACGAHLNHWHLVDQAVGRFYSDILWELGELIRRSAGATAEGAARVVKSVAKDKGVTEADHKPLPRTTRKQRQERVVKEMRKPA